MSISLIHRSRLALLVLLVIAISVIASGCSSLTDSGGEPADADTGSVESESNAPPPTPMSIKEPSPATTVPVTPPATPLVKPTSEVATSTISTEIDSLLLDEPGVYGVIVVLPDGTIAYARNSNLPFVAASLYKLVLMAEIYAMSESGNVSLTDTIELEPSWFEDPANADDSFFSPEDTGAPVAIADLLFATGAWSSNIAAEALLTLTTPDALRDRAVALGMNDTYVSIEPEDIANWPDHFDDSNNPDAYEAIAFSEAQAFDSLINLTTPADIAVYWQKLLSNGLVSESTSQAILEILSQQVVTDRIPALLPEETDVANKTGNLDHVAHDTGVIYTTDGPVTVVVLTEGEPDVAHATQLIQRIALIATGESAIPPIESQ